MVISNTYRNALEEVYVILELLDEEDYNNIPSNVIEAIDENRNKTYKYKINDDLNLQNQEMLPETRAILFNLFRDYLSTSEQKEKIINMQKEERRKNEERKKKEYNTDLFKKKERIQKDISNSTQMIEYKENIFRKILNRLKLLFNIKK